jgi:hypothetical protein
VLLASAITGQQVEQGSGQQRGGDRGDDEGDLHGFGDHAGLPGDEPDDEGDQTATPEHRADRTGLTPRHADRPADHGADPGLAHQQRGEE